jgi:hypothetical protein
MVPHGGRIQSVGNDGDGTMEGDDDNMDGTSLGLDFGPEWGSGSRGSS